MGAAYLAFKFSATSRLDDLLILFLVHVAIPPYPNFEFCGMALEIGRKRVKP